MERRIRARGGDGGGGGQQLGEKRRGAPTIPLTAPRLFRCRLPPPPSRLSCVSSRCRVLSFLLVFALLDVSYNRALLCTTQSCTARHSPSLSYCFFGSRRLAPDQRSTQLYTHTHTYTYPTERTWLGTVESWFAAARLRLPLPSFVFFSLREHGGEGRARRDGQSTPLPVESCAPGSARSFHSPLPRAGTSVLPAGRTRTLDSPCSSHLVLCAPPSSVLCSTYLDAVTLRAQEGLRSTSLHDKHGLSLTAAGHGGPGGSAVLSSRPRQTQAGALAGPPHAGDRG